MLQKPPNPNRSVPRIALRAILGVAAGLPLGVGLYTFVYARGASYLFDDPKACANCHVMQPYYDAWSRGSHHAVATCNDCHTPHNFLGKYAVKAENGFRHSLAFTTGWFHEPIQITPTDRLVAEGTCRHCHADIVAAIDAPHAAGDGQPIECIRCHRNVGHLH
jgi:cytochrome c nitrite reductase small subunit